MFPVFVNDGSQEMPDDDIMYIVCKEGIYLKKKLGIMESITPVKEVSILNSVEMTATMHIKPIPGTQFAPVMDFFSKIYKEHRAEGIVLLFYNEEKNVYKIVPPAQEVSGAGVDYTRAMTVEGYVMVGDIHSHANFSAFHSGTDDADEKSFDGLHITIGNNGSTDVSISASIVSNGQRFIVQPEDYINGITLTVDIDEEVDKPYSTVYAWDVNLKKLVPRRSNKTYKVRRFDRRYISSVSKKYQKCPDAWMSLVSKKKWTTYRGGYYGGKVGQPYGAATWRNWNTDNFDPNAWAEHKKLTSPQAKPPLVPATTKPVTFPPHVQTGPHEEVIDDDFNPCSICPFKEHKVDWVLENLTNEKTEQSDPYEEWYECDKCSTIFSSWDDNVICPECQVDDHLMLLDLDDINSKTSDDIPTADNYSYKCKECATETSVLNHGQCPFCGGDVMDIIDADALKVAAEEDETLETIPIPDPDADKIPLGTRKKARRPGLLARLLNKGKS